MNKKNCSPKHISDKRDAGNFHKHNFISFIFVQMHIYFLLKVPQEVLKSGQLLARHQFNLDRRVIINQMLAK